MAITTTLQHVEALYIGYFGRAGDPDGTNYWINKLNSGFSLADAAASFSVQPEAKAAYAYLKHPTLVTPTDFVAQLYQNLFNRAPDDAGWAYWVAELTANQGNPAYVGNFILSVINGAYGAGGSGTDVATIENKVAAGSYFTELAAAKNGVLTETKPDGTVVLTAEAKLGAAAAVGSAVTSDLDSVNASKAASDGFMPKKLTIGVDTLVGTSSNDTFDAPETSNSFTLNAGDSLDGGAGIDTLKMGHTGPITAVTALNIKSIEIANLTSTTGGVAMDTTTWAGLTNLNTTSVGSATLTAAATTDVKATVAAHAGAIVVNGGKDVSVTATGVTSGAMSVGADAAPTGAVTVAKTISAAGNVAGGAITIKGGTTVTSTTTATNTNLAGTNVTQGDVTVTGTAATTSVTVKQSATVAAGANVTESVVVTWKAMAMVAGSQTIGGMTIAASNAAGYTAAEVATVAGGGVVAGLTITTAPTAWTVAAAVGATNVFTSTTPNANVANISGAAFNGAGNSIPTAVTTNGSAAGVGGITAGNVTINDANAASLTAAGSITTVSLENFGVSTVNSGALSSLTLAGKGTTVTETAGALTIPTATTLALNLNGVTTSGAVTLDADHTTLNISAGTAASTLASLAASGAKTVNINGDKAVTLTSHTLDAAATITSTNTAGVTLTAALGTGVTFAGGAGADSIRLTSGFTKAITMGAGDDTVTYGGAAGVGGSVNAGDGIDTIVMTGAEAADASATGEFNSKFSGFDALTITASGPANVNLAGINGIQTVNTFGQTGILALSGLLSGATINLTGAPGLGGDVQAIVTNADVSASDIVNVKLTNSNLGFGNFGKVTAADVETINISTVDAGTAANTAATADLATLVATSATKIVVSGNNGLNLINTGNTKVVSFDASGVVGNDATDTAANLAVTFASANTDVAAVVSITGGAGNDKLTGGVGEDTIIGGAGNDTISGGAGDDTITGGTGIDTLTGGAGSDTFVFAAGDAGVTGTEKITDFSIALGGDKLGFVSTTLIANTVGATSVNSAVVGAVDLLATVKDGYITLSGADAGLVTSIGQIKAIFELLDANAIAEVGAIALNGHTYVLADSAANSVIDIIQLAGVTGVTGLSTADAANSIWIM